jgi:hypothetical protein
MSSGWWKRPGVLVSSAILLGVLLRTYHYARDPVVWHDEAALLVNVLPLGFGELLGPLRHAEAAPFLFLWLERGTALVLGDGTLALRLPPFLASLAALGLVAWTTWRESGPKGAAWTSLLFATSDRLLWHACEAKPYAFDVLCAAALLALLSATRDWRIERRIWAFLPIAPFVVWISYPGCFLCGGLLLALLPAVWRDSRPATLVAFTALGTTVVGSFALVYFGPAQAQRCGAMEACWTGQFADWSRPWSVPLWSIASTLEVARYCFMPWGFLLAVYVVVGAVGLCRAGRGDFVTAAAAPLGLNLMAAWLHGYPYGAARVVAHAAPGLAILIGAGVGPSLDWIHGRGRAAAVAAVVVLLIPLGLSLYRVAVPWYRPDCSVAAQYVLCHRSVAEPVFANHWQFEYYCRGIGGQFAYVPPDFSLPDGRTWVLLTAYEAAERDANVAQMSRQRRVLDRQEYDGATALLLDSISQFVQTLDDSARSLPPCGGGLGWGAVAEPPP